MRDDSDKKKFDKVFENFKQKLNLSNKDNLYGLFFDFCNQIGIDLDKAYNVLANDPKIMHSYVCFLKGHEIKNRPLNFKKNSDYGTVIIEDRCLPHLECLIRNTILKTPNNWNHSIVCTQMNFEAIDKLCKNIHKNIKVIPVSIPSFSQNTYKATSYKQNDYHV